MTAVVGCVTAMADLRAKTRLRTAVSPTGGRQADVAEEADWEAAGGVKPTPKDRARGGRGGKGALAAP